MINGKLTVLAPAKINLYFGVIGKRDDGYHEIETILQTVDLCDRISLELCDGDETSVSVMCGGLENVSERENIAYKAAMKYIEAAKLEKIAVKIKIDKKIPDGAGLGGGSSDAAAVLLAMNKLCGESFSTEDLLSIAAGIGADVPFCVKKGTVCATGFGEEIKSCVPMPDCRIVIAVPKGEKVSTAEAYSRFGENVYPSELASAIASLDTCDFAEIKKYMKNDFESTLEKDSSSMKIRGELLSLGAVAAQLSGSGPAVFGIFGSQPEAKNAAEKLEQSANVYICAPARRDYAYFEK